MTSECPSCKKQIEHEDFLFEVKCPHCSCRFNPFMGANPEVSGLDNVGPANMDNEGGDEAADSGGKFDESQAMFQDIREYGESLGTENEKPIMPPPSPAKADSGAANPSRQSAISFAPVPEGEEFPVTAGDAFQGHVIETYLLPISVWSDLDAASSNPLKAGFDLLAEQARAAGANGVVALRWSLSADSTKVLMTGTPVRCAKS